MDEAKINSERKVKKKKKKKYNPPTIWKPGMPLRGGLNGK